MYEETPAAREALELAHSIILKKLEEKLGHFAAIEACIHEIPLTEDGRALTPHQKVFVICSAAYAVLMGETDTREIHPYSEGGGSLLGVAGSLTANACWDMATRLNLIDPENGPPDWLLDVPSWLPEVEDNL